MFRKTASLAIAFVAIFATVATFVSAGPVPSVGIYWLENFDPATGGGVNAPLNQLLIRTDAPSLYYKSGTANTAWTRLGSGTSAVTAVTGTFPIAVTNDAGVYNVTSATAVTGTFPIAVTLNDAGVYSVTQSIDPDGGLALDDAGLRLGSQINVDIQQVKGVTMMGPVNLAPVLYSTDPGVLSVVQVTTPNSVGSMAVDLTATGTTDWMSAVIANGFVSRKINGSHAIIYPTPVSLATGSIANGTCASCPFNITWTQSDSTGQTGSPGTSPLFEQVSASSTVAGFGMLYRITALPTQQVARLYLAAGANTQSQTCTGMLTDGSASPVSTTPIVTAGGSTYFRQTWTFAARIIGAELDIYCRSTVSPGGSPTGVTWFAIALSPT